MRIILCFLLALVAAPAWAEWMKLGSTDTATIYIDSDRIRNDGNFRKVWEIQDLKERDTDGTMSMRALFEYDCKEERFRILAGSGHSEPMAGGETLWSVDDPSKWSAIPPDTVAEEIIKFACAK